MDKLTLATVCIVGFVAVFLPAAFAGGFYCHTCTSHPLTSVSHCNMSATSRDCENDGAGSYDCFAVTAELMNGTFVGFKECFKGNGCNSTTACDKAKNATSVSFKHCVADCCSQGQCNRYLPALSPLSSQVPATASLSVNASQSPSAATSPSTTAPTEKPTSAGSIIKLSTYLAIIFLVVIQITS